MLKAITAAIMVRQILIKTFLSGDLGRGDCTFGDITQFLTKSLIFELGISGQ